MVQGPQFYLLFPKASTSPSYSLLPPWLQFSPPQEALLGRDIGRMAVAGGSHISPEER